MRIKVTDVFKIGFFLLKKMRFMRNTFNSGIEFEDLSFLLFFAHIYMKELKYFLYECLLLIEK